MDKDTIIILLDYKSRFESKYTAVPYRSGMNKEKLRDEFISKGYEVKFLEFSEVKFRYDWKDVIVLYTSQEDFDYKYKSFIEDVILGLELAGAIVLPAYKLLRANNNKVFMEILRDVIPFEGIKGITSKVFGTIEELESSIDSIEFPVVLKTAGGAMSRGVSLASNRTELISQVKKISRSLQPKSELRDFIRSKRWKGYIKESKFRNKFIIQNMIPNLANDYKVLIYGTKYFFLRRDVKKNDFRASGSGRFSFLKEYPEGMLEYAKSIRDLLEVPNISLDVCFDGKDFYIIEFQALYFGTTTIEKSLFHYVFSEGEFKIVDEKPVLEKVYVESIVHFLSK